MAENDKKIVWQSKPDMMITDKFRLVKQKHESTGHDMLIAEVLVESESGNFWLNIKDSKLAPELAATFYYVWASEMMGVLYLENENN